MQKLHYWGTAILMWVASVLLQLMALIGLVHVAIDLAIPPSNPLDIRSMVTDVLTSLALIELAWMSATWAMEHALRLAFLLDVCLIFIAREIIDKTYTGHVTPMGAGVLIGVFLALLGGRWLTGKIYRLA